MKIILKSFFLLSLVVFNIYLSKSNNVKKKYKPKFLDRNLFETVQVQMRDGTKLAVDYFKPNKQEKYPVILEITPYGKSTGQAANFHTEADYWWNQGYIFVIADARGTGDSQGEFEFLSREGDDGYDLIEWISKQDWSNGKIGMRGYSYSGTNQWLIAAKKPKNLYCITPSTTLGRPIEHMPYNSAFTLLFTLNWSGKNLKLKNNSIKWVNEDPEKWLKHRPLSSLDVFAAGRELPVYRKFLSHPTLDSFWDSTIMKPENYSNINIPSLSFSGWYDFALYGTIMRYKEANKYGRNKDNFLVIGPYDHYHAPHGGYHAVTGLPIKIAGDIILDDNSLQPALNITKEFFDWCLKNATRPNWNKTKVYITGSNKWQEGSFFNQDNFKDVYLYLGKKVGDNKNAKLLTEILECSNDTYDYDPSDPVRVDLTKKHTYPLDMNFYFNRSDFLVYTSEVLKKPFQIFGEVKLDLVFSSNVKDTDFVAFLMDVYEDGRSIKLGSIEANTFRTRYRKGYDKEVLLEENEIDTLTINMHELAHTFLPGHKIRVTITSSFYPILSVNLNTGYSIANDTAPGVKSTQTIYYGIKINDTISRIHFKSNVNILECF